MRNFRDGFANFSSRQILKKITLFFFSAFIWSTPLCASELKIGGTGNALGSMRLLATEFTKQNPDIKITILSSLGSSGAIKAVPKRAIDIGLTSRALTPEELKAGSKATEYALTPTVLAVPSKSTLKNLTRQQIADIYKGTLTSLPDGSYIRPVLRQPGDDNTRQLQGLSPEIQEALKVAENRPGMAFAATDQEAADKMENSAGALGVTTLALILSESRSLRAIALDGIEPSIENASAGRYPITKSFYFITEQTPSPDVQKFMDFVASPAGRKILSHNGHWFP